MKQKKSRSGFTLVDFTALIAMLVAVSAVAAPTLNGAWKNRMARSSANNLHVLGVASAMYSAANGDKIPTYSWRGGGTYTMPDGRMVSPLNDLGAAIYQNKAILMEMTGRIDISVQFQRLPTIPHRRFVHLVLWDFLGSKFSTEVFVDPLDANMLRWHRDSMNLSTMPYTGQVFPGFDTHWIWRLFSMRERWGFSPSYFTVPTAWMGQGKEAQWAPIQSTMHIFKSTGAQRPLHLGNQQSAVVFPSSKVYMHEEYDRRQGPVPTHYAYDFARPMKLMFDGSLNVQTSGEGTSSVSPLQPSEPWTQPYIPLHTYPAPFGGMGDPAPLNLRYRWTAGGLSGVDYTP